MLKNLNYILILITVALLAMIGVAFIVGASFSWMRSEADEMWRQTYMYQNYVRSMNMVVGPPAVGLVIVLGLCIPKRLFTGATLLKFMGGMLLFTAVLSVAAGPRIGIGILLITAALLQLLVILMTLSGNKRLHYEVTGFYLQIGSALLHLGLIIFLFDLILVGDAADRLPAHLSIFWVSTALMVPGMVMVFYSREIARLFKRRGRMIPDRPSLPR